MNAALVAILAEVLACQARMLGMQAENEYRRTCGESPAYCEEAFSVVSCRLQELSIAARNAS